MPRGILANLWLLELSLVFIAMYEKSKYWKPKLQRNIKKALQLFQTGSNCPISTGFSLKERKSTRFVCFVFFLLQCATSSVWKCYVTLGIVNHCSIQPQTNKGLVTSPVLPVNKVWWRSGWCFPHLMEVGVLDELTVPEDGSVRGGCQCV